jgi:hypothetical protein
MTPQENPRTEERHEDFQSVVTVGKEIKSALLRYLIPAVLAGVGMLVVNHFNQIKLVEKFGVFERNFAAFQHEQRAYNRRTDEMWYRGGYRERHDYDKPNDK